MPELPTKSKLLADVVRALPSKLRGRYEYPRAIIWAGCGKFELALLTDHEDAETRNLLEELIEEQGWVEITYERQARGYSCMAADSTHRREIVTSGPTKAFAIAAAFVEAMGAQGG